MAGTLSEMRRPSATTVLSTFVAAPPDLSGVEEVSIVAVTGQVVTGQAHGSTSPLPQVLAGAMRWSW